MEYVDWICSLESRLFFGTSYPVQIIYILEVIAKTRFSKIKKECATLVLSVKITMFEGFVNTTGFGAPNEEDDEANDSDLFGDNSEADSEEYPYSDQERLLNYFLKH